MDGISSHRDVVAPPLLRQRRPPGTARHAVRRHGVLCARATRAGGRACEAAGASAAVADRLFLALSRDRTAASGGCLCLLHGGRLTPAGARPSLPARMRRRTSAWPCTLRLTSASGSAASTWPTRTSRRCRGRTRKVGAVHARGRGGRNDGCHAAAADGASQCTALMPRQHRIIRATIRSLASPPLVPMLLPAGRIAVAVAADFLAAFGLASTRACLLAETGLVSVPPAADAIQ